MTNKRKKIVVLSGQRTFDSSRLIRQAGIELESRRPTEGTAFSDRDKRDFKTDYNTFLSIPPARNILFPSMYFGCYSALFFLISSHPPLIQTGLICALFMLHDCQQQIRFCRNFLASVVGKVDVFASGEFYCVSSTPFFPCDHIMSYTWSSNISELKHCAKHLMATFNLLQLCGEHL